MENIQNIFLEREKRKREKRKRGEETGAENFKTLTK